MKYNILDTQRKEILPLFCDNFSEFYLAGGTALALYIGHRNSIDFDFFTPHNFSPSALFLRVQKIFAAHTIVQTQNEENTLSILLDNEIQISFFTYPYPLLKPLKKEKYFFIASTKDIAAMKCLALVQRATQKDYIDMAFLLQQYPLSQIILFAQEKFPMLSSELIIKSMVYFDDIQTEYIEYKDKEHSWQEIQSILKKAVENFL